MRVHCPQLHRPRLRSGNPGNTTDRTHVRPVLCNYGLYTVRRLRSSHADEDLTLPRPAACTPGHRKQLVVKPSAIHAKEPPTRTQTRLRVRICEPGLRTPNISCNACPSGEATRRNRRHCFVCTGGRTAATTCDTCRRVATTTITTPAPQPRYRHIHDRRVFVRECIAGRVMRLERSTPYHVPTAASQALHQLPATCACLAGATGLERRHAML